MSVRRHLMDSSTMNNEKRRAQQQEDAVFHRTFLRHFFDLDGMATQRRNDFLDGSVIADLKGNKANFRELKLSSVHTRLDCYDLHQSIRLNKTVRSVRIHGFFLEKLPRSYQQRILEAIGSLPKLEELHLSYFLDFPLSAEALYTVLSRATNLAKLSIHDARFEGKIQDVYLRENLSLVRVTFSQLYLSEPNDTLDSLIHLFISAPNLCMLAIRMAQKAADLLSNKTLEILSKKQLKTLELRKVVLSNDQLVQFMQRLTRLQDGKTPSSCLRDLVLECADFLEYKSCGSIGSMLHKNQTLERLELWGESVDEWGIPYIADKVKENRKLQALYLSHNINMEGQKSLVDMLAQNHVLTELSILPFVNEDLLNRTSFFLKLNSTCLRRLLLDINASREQICDKLVVHSDNLNYLYHILQGNPTFLRC